MLDHDVSCPTSCLHVVYASSAALGCSGAAAATLLALTGRPCVPPCCAQVHSTLDGYCRSDFVFPVEVGSVRHMVSVRQRPHLHTFLQRMAELFEVVVFTASQRVYAEQLLNLVDPGRTLIRHRIFRESCVLWEGNYLKDLTGEGGREGGTKERTNERIERKC